MKYLVLDAGPIIALSMNGLLPVLEKLKKKFKGEFVITPSVKREVVERPMKIKQFKLEAIKVKHLIETGVLRLTTDFVNQNDLVKETNRILKASNGFLRSVKTGEKVEILHEGEASCLAFVNLVSEASLIVVDERTTRLLFESPKEMANVMGKKLHTEFDTNVGLIKDLGHFKFVRSSELVYVAYKKNLIDYGQGKDVLDALMYGLKYRGTTISSKEIEIIKSKA